MITRILNVRAAGPGRLAFEIETGGARSYESLLVQLGSDDIRFRLELPPNAHSTHVLEHGKGGRYDVIVRSESSGVMAENSLHFEEPDPTDIVFCEACKKWHERGGKC
jgi:hypothetical protein